MNGFKTNILRIPLVILVLSFTTASVALAAPISLKYVGTGWNTSVDNYDDGFPITISTADAKGSFGASRVEITGEWMQGDFGGVECDEGYIELILAFSASVATFENQSQLFAFSDVGWMCVNTSPESGHYHGQVFGIYQGGSGRFEGASGQWMTDYSGFFLEPPIFNPSGFRSISGTVKGNVELP